MSRHLPAGKTFQQPSQTTPSKKVKQMGTGTSTSILDKTEEEQTAEIENVLDEFKKKIMNLHRSNVEGRTKLRRDIELLQSELQKEKEQSAVKLKSQHEKHERLHAEWQKCKQSLENNIEDYKTRLSEMASRKMKQGNPCVEDLSDPNRHTAIAQAWEEFFGTGEYWTTYERLKQLPELGDDDVGKILYTVCQVIYTTCVVHAPGKATKEASAPKQTLVAGQLSTEQAEEQFNNKIHPGNQALTKPQKSISQTSPLDLKERCLRNVQRAGLSVDVQQLSNFTERLVDLCRRMRTLAIPLTVDFTYGPGSPFDGSLFVEENSKPLSPDSLICFILRPPLLRHAGGSILIKGVAVVSEGSTQAKSEERGTHGQCTAASSEKQNKQESDQATPPKDPADPAAKPELSQKPPETADIHGTAASSEQENKEGQDQATPPKDPADPAAKPELSQKPPETADIHGTAASSEQENKQESDQATPPKDPADPAAKQESSQKPPETADIHGTAASSEKENKEGQDQATPPKDPADPAAKPESSQKPPETADIHGTAASSEQENKEGSDQATHMKTDERTALRDEQEQSQTPTQKSVLQGQGPHDSSEGSEQEGSVTDVASNKGTLTMAEESARLTNVREQH